MKKGFTKILLVGLAVSMLFTGCGPKTGNTSKGSSSSVAESAGSQDIKGDDSTIMSSTMNSSGTNELKPPAKTEGKSYYVSSSGGNDANPGTAQGKPLKTLAKAASLALKPGDRIYLKKGDIWKESVTLKSSGTADSPIILSSYGDGARPQIQSGDKAAIVLSNCAGYYIEDLSFSNSAIGVLYKNENDSEGNYLAVSKCDFSDGELAQPAAGSTVSFKTELAAGASGVVLATKSKSKTVLKNITVSGCDFVGISVGVASYSLDDFKKLAYSSAREAAVFSGVTVTGCTFRELEGSALLLNNAASVSIKGCEISEACHYGTGFGADGAIRLAFCKGVTIENTKVDTTYAYASGSSGSGIYFAGGNSDVTVKGCEISNNIGPAFKADAHALSPKANGAISFSSCTFSDNNTSKTGGNVAFAVASGKPTVKLTGCKTILHNNKQSYNTNVTLSGGSVINAAGKAISGSASGVTATTLRIGTGMAKITPEEPVQLQGYSHSPSDPNYSYEYCDPSKDFYDDIYARAAILEDSKNGNKILILTFDICQMREGYEVPAGTFAKWAAAAGVKSENVLTIPEHNHQSVTTLADKYIARVTDAIKKAASSMKTVKMGYTVEACYTGANRRPNLNVSESLTQDNRMTIYNFTDVEDGSLVTTFFHYPIHNTSIGKGRMNYWKMLSSELTGLAAKAVEAELGLPAAFHIDGFGGDVGPNIDGEPSADYAAVKAAAQKMADQVVKQSKNTPTKAIAAGLNFTKKTEVYAGRKDFPIVMTGFRLGNIGFFGLNMEGFSETAANIIANSPFEHTMVSGLVLGSSGYAPSAAAFKDGLGGYEVKDACNFPSTIETFILQRATEMLNSLAGTKPGQLKISAVSGTPGESGSDLKNAIDGKETTSYLPGTSDFNVTVDLGSVKTVQNFVIHFGDYLKRETARKYTVWASEDAAFTNPVLIGYETDNTSPQLGYRTNVKARYIRIVCTEGYSSSYTPAVYSIRVYGK